MAEHALEPFNYLIISDLHLQEAEKNPAGRLFYFDQEFADFLRHYRLFYVGERRWKLIIAGDLIEFLHIKERPKPDDKFLQGIDLTPTDVKFFPGTEWQKSVWKLHLILSSHPQLLLALARFVAAGNEIYILRGNHDLELYWPEVQNRFRLLVAQHHPVDTSYLDMKAAASERIHFVPSFYLEKDLLYVEHGHQYDPYCSNAHNLCPVLPKDPRQIELALSAFTMRYFAARIQSVDPAAMENINSIPKYLMHLIRSNPAQVALMPLYYLEMLVRTLGKVRRAEPALESAVARMEVNIREEVKGGYGLSEAALRTLERLAYPPVLLSRWQTVKCFSLDLLVAGVAALVLGGSLYLVGVTPLGRWVPAAVSFLFLCALFLVEKNRMGKFNDHRNLREIARVIRDALGVRYVVFGHSHDPDVYPVSAAEDGCYFNVGTWVPGTSEGQFVYLQILRRAEGISAYLMRWHRRRQQPEELDPASYTKGRVEREAMLAGETSGARGEGEPTPAP